MPIYIGRPNKVGHSERNFLTIIEHMFLICKYYFFACPLIFSVAMLIKLTDHFEVSADVLLGHDEKGLELLSDYETSLIQAARQANQRVQDDAPGILVSHEQTRKRLCVTRKSRIICVFSNYTFKERKCYPPVLRCALAFLK